mmetsp:Transcript_65421/g.212893  ORF Transcript_65421/g.212893 Transcript_65421/m.212893 type:complete len:220 (+) Transcript_65421:155-814(+)
MQPSTFSPCFRFAPGQLQDAETMPSSIFPSCASTFPSLFVTWKTTTATTRSTELGPSGARTQAPSAISSLILSMAPLPLILPKLPMPMSGSMSELTFAAMCFGMDQRRSPKSVKGTERSVGQLVLGGTADATRRVNWRPYSATTILKLPWLVTELTKSERLMVITLHEERHSTVPTWIHWHQRAASHNQASRSTMSSVVNSTGEDPGSCTYFICPCTAM